MSIHKIGSDLVRPSGTQDSRRGSASQQTDGDELKRVERADRVDISAEGRELAARLADEAERAAATEPEVIRERIRSGFYDDPGVAEKVADALLQSGHLDVEA